MSDRVPDDRKAEVLRLRYIEGLSTRAIARQLSMARRTVRAILGEKRPRRRIAAERATRDSILAPYETEIRTRLNSDPGLRAPGLLEHLRLIGYRGGVTVLRDRMRVLRPRPHIEVFSSFTHIRPAERLEVDWASLGYVLPGVPREVSIFVAVLVYSRMLYLEFVLSRAMGSFLRCLERALSFFGGLTAVDVFDNMKTVVLERDAERVVQFVKPRYGAPVAETRDKVSHGGRGEREIYKVRWESGAEHAVLTAEKGRRRATLSVSRGDFEEEIYRVR